MPQHSLIRYTETCMVVMLNCCKLLSMKVKYNVGELKCVILCIGFCVVYACVVTEWLSTYTMHSVCTSVVNRQGTEGYCSCFVRLCEFVVTA